MASGRTEKTKERNAHLRFARRSSAPVTKRATHGRRQPPVCAGGLSITSPPRHTVTLFEGIMDDKIKIDLSVSDETTETKKNSQARDWCFTINNPVQSEQEFITYLKTLPDLRYVVFQREKAPETGTEHYQGYFEFTQQKWFTTIKKYLSKANIGVDAHIEARRGKRSQAREYCMDEETRISPQFYEYSEFIEDGERTDLTDIMHDIENGMSFYDLSKKHGNRFIRVMKWAKEYRQSHLENKFKRVFRNMKVYYIYGSAGCGKTSYVFQKHGYDDVYRTTNYEFGWIDDYNGEKILFLDEFRSSFKISEILDYLDGQPIRIRGRHYNRVACYDTVYIVSNLSLKEQYTNIQQSEPKTWAAFCRRITAVYDFDKSKDIPVNKFTGELKKPPTLIEIADDGDMPF